MTNHPDSDRKPILTFRQLKVSTWALLEALFWTVGFLFAQGLILLGFLAILLTASFGTHWPGEEGLIKWVLDLDLDRSFLLVGVPILGAAFLILPAIRLREGSEFRTRIGWRFPTSDELVYSLAMVVPVSLMGNVIYDVLNVWWLEEKIIWPFAMAVQEGTLEKLHQSFHGVPYPVLVVSLALAPAFLEELVFRGMLGRRLVEKCGVFTGVLISSLLFAGIHGSPPHAMATIPIAVLLHLLYLQTGTIWVPVLVHFANNLLAVSFVHFHLEHDTRVSALFMGILTIYLLAMLGLLHLRLTGRTLSGVLTRVKCLS